MTLNEIREALQDRRLSVIAERTGIHENTIRAIRDGKNTNPTLGVFSVLSDYLKGNAGGDDDKA
jgi:hypothetical protein